MYIYGYHLKVKCSYCCIIIKFTRRTSTIFFLWTRALKHNKFVEIKQFSKVDIKQINVSTVIFLIKFLVKQRDPCHLQGSRVVYIFVYITKSVFYLISNHIFVYINHEDTFYSVNKWCAQRFIEFIDEKLKPKVQIEEEFIYIMN